MVANLSEVISKLLDGIWSRLQTKAGFFYSCYQDISFSSI